jgi:Sister chromatid cohesion protein Dcc1
MRKWRASIPEAIDQIQPSLDMLSGNFYHPTSTTIQYLPSSTLSSIPEQRFTQLFGVKEKWGFTEIMPFLEGCVESGEGWEKKAERECQKWARVRNGMVTRR